MMSMRPLYVSDLDGTLLDGKARLSDFSRDAINRMLGQGLRFTAASARSVVSMRSCLAGLEISLPVIEFSGAFISDLDTGKHFTVNEMRKRDLEALSGLFAESGVECFVSSFDGTEDRLHFGSASNAGQAFYLSERRRMSDPRLSVGVDVRAKLGEQVVACTVIDRLDRLAPIQRVVAEDFSSHLVSTLVPYFYFEGWHWLTIQDRGSTKGKALEQLQESYAPDTGQRVVFGDEVNDLPMFEAADRAYATAGAIDAIKGAATEGIGAKDEDAGARYIQSDFAAPG